MIIEYNEKTFFYSFINEYIEVSNDHDKSEIIFQKHYNKLLQTFNINDIIHHYSNNYNDDDNYDDYNNYDNNDDNNDDNNKIKLGLILHLKLIVYIMNDYYNDDDFCSN
jgi:hypothetical protein